MTDDDLFDLLDPTLGPLGFRLEDGEEFATPRLDILRYHVRPVRLHWTPLLGRSQAVVAVVRQPVDLAGTEVGCKTLIDRLSRAASTRFPPGWTQGYGSIALTTVILTPEPIKVEDDATLAAGLKFSARSRVIPLALIRLNLGQEAMAFALSSGPPGLFPEPLALTDALTEKFRRFVPFMLE